MSNRSGKVALTANNRPYGRLYLLGQQHQDSIVPCDAPFDSSNTDELQIRYQRPYGRLTMYFHDKVKYFYTIF